MIYLVGILSFILGFTLSTEMWKIGARRHKEQMFEEQATFEDDNGRIVTEYRRK